MWKNISINKSNVVHETANAVLIKMPKSSGLSSFEFWHPKKLVRKGYHSNALSISYTNEFTFKLKKMGKGKYNKYDVLEEKEISAEEFEKYFETINKNITEPKEDNESYLIVKEPDKIQVETKVKEELKNA